MKRHPGMRREDSVLNALAARRPRRIDPRSAVLDAECRGRASGRGRRCQDFAPSTSSMCEGKRVLVRVDFNVPMQNGEVTDATRIERACADARGAGRQGGQGRRAVAFRPPQGQARELDEPGAAGQAAVNGAGRDRRPVRAGLRRRARPCSGRRPARRRRGAAREPALPCRRGEGRPGLRRPAGDAGRPLRQRRVLGLAPRPRLGHRPGRAAAALCRPSDAGRAGGAGGGAGRRRAPDRGGDRRRQGVQQARRARATSWSGSTC